jgi:hypothetical protein
MKPGSERKGRGEMRLAVRCSSYMKYSFQFAEVARR